MKLVDTLDLALPAPRAAAYLGLSESTLANLRYLGGGPEYQKGPGRRGAVRYPISALEKWRALRMRESTSEACPLRASPQLQGGENVA